MEINRIIHGNCLEQLKQIPEESINQIITSPPYWNLRDYEVGPNALGNEPNPHDYLNNLFTIIQEIYRVLKKDGNFILNLGDRYYNNNGRHRCNIEKYKRSTHKHFSKITPLKNIDNYRQEKQLLLQPSRIAIKMQDKGQWLVRNEFIWVKSNACPNGAPDRARPITEKLFLCVKSKKYFCDTKAKNKWLPIDIINCPIKRFGTIHQASFPEKLIEPFILSFSKKGDLILDPFNGSGTVPTVAKRLGRNFIGIDLSEEYCEISRKRVK